MTPRKPVLAAFMTLMGLIALGEGASSPSANTKAKEEVTFSKDVAPIFFKSCTECHRPGEAAPMSLLSYKNARPWARSIKEKVVTREMPPWHADPKYGEFRNEHKLSQKEIETIVAWVDQGAKEGNPKDLPAKPEFLAEGGWQIGKPDVVLSMREEWTVEVNAPDNYINFFIPTDFKEDKWVEAAEIQPGNRKVVHHVIAFIVSPAGMERRKQAQASGTRRGGGNPNSFMDGTLRRTRMEAPVNDNACEQPAGGRGQRGGGDENEGTLLAGFAPGMGVTRWMPGQAKKVPAGSTIMFQMHYSAFRGSLDKAQKDRTKIGLIFARQAPDKMVLTWPISNRSFKIPPGAADHEVKACATLPRDLRLVSYMPHMHLRGKSMKYEVVYPDGRQETLLWVPKFNFNWQAQYYLKSPIALPKGAKVIVTATFDNSTKNKYNPNPNIPVRWGDPTYDEMMIGWLDFIIDNPSRQETASKGGN